MDSQTAVESKSSTALAVVQDMREVRDSLGSRPTLAEVEEAAKDIVRIDENLVSQLEVLTAEGSGLRGGSSLLESLLALKEDVIRTKAELEKRKPQAVLDMHAKFHHYDKMIMMAEEALVTGLTDKTIAKPEAESSPQLALTEPQAGKSLKEGKPPLPRIFKRTQPDVFTSALSPDSTLHLSGSESPVSQKSASGPSSPAGRTLSLGRETSRETRCLPAARSLPSTSAKVAPCSSGTQLNSISEDAPLEVDPKVLQVVETAAADKRLTLDLQGEHFKCPLSFLPDSVGLLDWLVELTVANNALVVLPSSIGNLFNLTRLDASCNQLVELPESIGRLPKLQVLDLHHNKLEEVPTSIGNCDALEELRLGFNSITGLPEAIGRLTNLRILSAPLNQLTYLPRRIGLLQNLVELDVHYNSLESIPDSIGKLESLEVLNVSANHFQLKSIPDSIGELKNLKKLDISENHIKVLPSTFTQLTSLTSLRLEGNPWQHPPIPVATKGLQAVMDFLSKGDEPQAQRVKKGGRLLGIFKQHSSPEDPALEAWRKRTMTF